MKPPPGHTNKPGTDSTACPPPWVTNERLVACRDLLLRTLNDFALGMADGVKVSAVLDNPFVWRVELDASHEASLRHQLKAHRLTFSRLKGVDEGADGATSPSDAAPDTLPDEPELGVLVLHVVFPCTYPADCPVIRLVRPMLEPLTGDCLGTRLQWRCCLCSTTERQGALQVAWCDFPNSKLRLGGTLVCVCVW